MSREKDKETKSQVVLPRESKAGNTMIVDDFHNTKALTKIKS